MQTIQIPLLENMHGHLRQGSPLALFVPFAAKYCRHYIAMGNTKPPILSEFDADNYHDTIYGYTPAKFKKTFKALPAIKVREDTAPETVRGALNGGHKLFKFYPRAKTTHADDGIQNYMSVSLRMCYKEIAAGGGYALFHPEHPGKRWDDTECEYAFFGIFEAIYNLVPTLNMVWEHLTDTRVLPFLLDMEPRVACTVTAHHLVLRLNDVLGKNHHLCRPPAKMLRDVEILRDYVVHGKSRRIMLGLDDAPHDLVHKECAHASCGVWSMPIAPQLIMQVFDEERTMESEMCPLELEQFVSTNAHAYYRLSPTFPPYQEKERLIMLREPFLVPEAYRLETTCDHQTVVSIRIKEQLLPTDYVPFMAGKTLRWSVINR